MTSKIKLLIVDDNAQFREMEKFYLHDLAIEIRECEDGAEAFGVYAEFLPDLVLMDWEMKRMDGLTATRKIVEKYPQAKVLIVTQHDDEQLKEAAQKEGAHGVVLKEDLMELRRQIILNDRDF
jgi:CheY-like chemotaxis protein